MSTSLKGKTAIVTGAGRGIGKAIAAHLVAEGAEVAIIDIDPVTAADTAAELGGYSVAADLTDPASVERAVDDASQQLGGLDIFVNNAGVCSTGELLSGDIDLWDKQFAVNTRAAYLCSAAAARKMIARDNPGSIVIITSNCASKPRMDLAAYCASKAATQMMAQCLALEVARQGIRVNTVNPGSCETDMQREQWAQLGVGPERQIQGDLSTFRSGIPLGRIAQPQDIANAVAILASDATSFVTGQSWYIDGGQTI
ncbi:SDR family NAD(P)-dependent oxidoreductase [Arthrobacter globiformis]|uniref:SDR family NAD(P)-dependent oxidoreductase n=1 Tax=Arthrobacter globiformis TaxID=1665 RepID=UPI000B413E70|nr:glucose 1-dehydrogenase [Arthrobacter globiformis]